MSAGSKDDDLGLLPFESVRPSQTGGGWTGLGRTVESPDDIRAALASLDEVEVAIAGGRTTIPCDAAPLIEDVAGCDDASLAVILDEAKTFVTAVPKDPNSGGDAGDLSAYRNPPFAISEAAREDIIERFNDGDPDE